MIPTVDVRKDNKKSRERLLLSEAIALCSDFQQTQYLDCEEPDFLFQTDSKSLGIELVDYIRGQNKDGSYYRKIEALRKKIIEAAELLFEAKNQIPVIVESSWYSRAKLRRDDIKKLAEEISSIVADNIPQESFDSITLDYDYFRGLLLGEHLRKLQITRMQKESRWVVQGAEWIESHISEIQGLISSKNAKYDRYKAKCDEIWLVIVADGEYLSSTVSLPQDVLVHAFETRFQRVFFYFRVEKQVVKLKLSAISGD